MSLWLHRRSIARAVAGDLTPAAEARLRGHLRGCAACRGHYDRLTTIAAAAAAGAPGEAARRQRAQLAFALGPNAGAATSRAAPRSRWPWLMPLGLAPALGLLALVLVRARSPEPEPEVRERGESGSATVAPGDDVRASLALRFYARRRRPGQAAGPVRLVGELPGSGELRATGDEELQLAYTGLKAPRHLVLLARTQQGTLQPIFPRAPPAPRAPGAAAPAEATALAPTQEPRLLGSAFELGPTSAPQRLELVAVVSRTALARAQIDSLLLHPRSPPAGAISLGGVLWIDP